MYSIKKLSIFLFVLLILPGFVNALTLSDFGDFFSGFWDFLSGAINNDNTCNNGVCDPGEETWCTADCYIDPSGPYCGDGTCDPGEETWCTSDCPFCGDGTCDSGEETWCTADCDEETPEPPGPYCGDGNCDPGEETWCSLDCVTPEPQPCTSAAWSCDDVWLPVICPISQIQTRTCTLIDTECSNPEAVKPDTTRSCTYIPPYIPPQDCTEAAWSCSDWQPEVCPESEIQTRTCTLIDTECLNPEAVKPAETQSCAYIPPETPDCTADAWSCTAWEPETCPESEIQTRTCTLIDTECLNPEAVKPSESKSCTYIPPETPACTLCDYECTDWQPEVCPESEIQTRTCALKAESDCDPDHPDSVKPAESKSCTYIPPQPPEPTEKVSSDLLFSSIIVDPECVAPGDEILIFVSVKNEGWTKLKNVKLTATIYELGIRSALGPFTIKKNSPISRAFFLDIPKTAKDGIYFIRLEASSYSDSTVKHRIIKVNEYC